MLRVRPRTYADLRLSTGFVAFDTFRNLLQDDKGKISGPRTVLAGLGAGVSMLPSIMPM